MDKSKCLDCICLVADENDEWICDELELPIKFVTKCPECEVEQMDDYIRITMGEEDWQEIVINDQLQLHITNNTDGICIDYYKYRTEAENISEDDFIGSRYFLWEDLEK